jgi:hypothetical protein
MVVVILDERENPDRRMYYTMYFGRDHQPSASKLTNVLIYTHIGLSRIRTAEWKWETSWYETNVVTIQKCKEMLYSFTSQQHFLAGIDASQFGVICS